MILAVTPKPVDEYVTGLVTVVNWTMAPDGHRYLFFWAKRWQVITDKEIPVENFHSSERWQLIAINKTGEVLAVFPGCQAKAWLKCERSPEGECYTFND